ncbi:MAG: hypothetical protein AAFX76_04410 [Planctomycetota bacterium]
MNSFLASCEQYDAPELRGRPVGVCPVLAKGGWASCPSSARRADGLNDFGLRPNDGRDAHPTTVLHHRKTAFTRLTNYFVRLK